MPECFMQVSSLSKCCIIEDHALTTSWIYCLKLLSYLLETYKDDGAMVKLVICICKVVYV